MLLVKNDDKPGPWLRRITSLLALGCLLLVLGDVAQKIFDIARTSSDKRTFAVLSAREASFDTHFRDLSGPTTGLSYAARDSDYGTQALKDAGVKNPAQHSVWLVTIAPGSKPTATSDMNEVMSAVSLVQTRRSARVPPLAACVVLAGLIVGFLFQRIPRPAETVLLMTAFSASAYKWLQACPICEPVRVFGIDAALVGTVLYGFLLLGTAWPPFARSLPLRSAAFAGVAMWQLLHFVVLRDPPCPACFTVLFANAAMVSLSLLAGVSLPNVSGSLSWKHAAALSGYVCFALVTLGLTRPAPLPKEEIQALASAHELKATGKSLAELSLPPSPEAAPHLELVVYEGCAPCAASEQFFSRKSYPIRIIEMYLEGSKPSGKFPSFERPRVTPLGAPTLLGVDRNGIVRFEFHGWSDSEAWQSMVEKRIASFLEPKSANGGNS